MKMRSHHAAFVSAVLADAVDECRVWVELRPFLESLVSSTSRPIFISHMAVVRSNFYTLEGNHVDLVASLKTFRGCFKVEAFY